MLHTTAPSKYNIHDLHVAINARQLDSVRRIVSFGILSINQPIHGATALSLSLYNNSNDAFNMLLDSNALRYNIDINQLSRDSSLRLESPLITAVRLGNRHAVGRLISEGADLEAVDGYGHTALWMAACERHFDIALQLIRHGASVQPSNKVSQMPIFIAIRPTTRRTDIGKLLIIAGSDGCNIECEPLLKRLLAPRRSEAIRLLLCATRVPLSVSFGANVDSDSAALMNEMLTEPAPLMFQCRFVIRKAILTAMHGKHFLPAVAQLPLPPKLRDFVALINELVGSKESLIEFGVEDETIQSWDSLAHHLMLK